MIVRDDSAVIMSHTGCRMFRSPSLQLDVIITAYKNKRTAMGKK
jgi:hypothetical protein